MSRFAIFAALAALVAGARADDLVARLDALAAEHGFTLGGRGRLEAAPAPPAHPDLAEHLRRLLADYNHVILHEDDGGVERVIITSRKQEAGTPISGRTPREHEVETKRSGAHQIVDAEIAGSRGRRLKLALVIDTGATTVVLPRSMIARLGFDESTLVRGRAQTANGLVESLGGTLTSVRVGNARARDVAVSFVDDARLGGAKLLGMSFLGRFSMTIDANGGRVLFTGE